jgi:hypothetical protein
VQGNSIYFQSNNQGSYDGGLRTNMIVQSNGIVTIGNAAPQGQLSVLGLADQEAISATGFSGITGNGSIGIYAAGGTASLTKENTVGGDAGYFLAGDGESTGFGGNAITASALCEGPLCLPGLAGSFLGGVNVTGTLSYPTSAMKIDHPQDPANAYLVHAAVSSSEMLNIYSGNAVTDEMGLATVNLPDWFESLNTDFRYQLTVIGQDAHAWVAQEVGGKQFKIGTNPAHVKVSWQITAVRQDPWAKAHPLVVEQPKNDRERGFYANPELYGQPEEKQLEWGRVPELMQRQKAKREAERQGARAGEESLPGAPQFGAPASAVDRQFARPSGTPTVPMAKSAGPNGGRAHPVK